MFHDFHPELTKLEVNYYGQRTIINYILIIYCCLHFTHHRVITQNNSTTLNL